MRLYVDSMLGGLAAGLARGSRSCAGSRPCGPATRSAARLTVLETTPSERRSDRGTVRIRGEMVNQDGVTVMAMTSRGHFGAAAMTGCCARHGQEEFFGEKTRAHDARKYRRKGADPMARSLARRAAARGVEGSTVLEIGGGVGQVALELLKAGAASAEVVELLPDYEPFVRELAPRRASRSGSPFRTADLVADPARRRPSDLVVMNKVVCCTPDGGRARRDRRLARPRTLVLSFPREVWWARAGLATVNSTCGCAAAASASSSIRRRRSRARSRRTGSRAPRCANGPLFRIAAFERV